MTGVVALHVPDSPMFSSPRMKASMYCKPCPSPPPSRTVLSLTSAAAGVSSAAPTPKSSLAIVEKVISGTAVLKRKRPARIDIPVTGSGWGNGGLEMARKEEATISEIMEVEGDGYSVYCKRGKRGHMEDRFSACVNFCGNSKQGFFGVYDGHGGYGAAEFAAKNMEKNVMSEIVNKSESDGIEEAVRNGYLRTDKGFLDQSSGGGGGGGAACVTAMIYKGDVVVSNAGDCRAVMSRGGAAEPLTSDHRPSRMDERDRIQALGGYVDCHRGVWRIQGSLAVTRGIGDKHLKEFVTAEPETKVLRIEADCEFLILASDGLWDKVTNQEAVDLVRPICVEVDKPEPFVACKKLAEMALERRSMDDISVMIIQLGRFAP